MAQQARAVRTRRVVLEAAARVFAERGYASATVAEILASAGVTKGALYFHFDSKQALAKGVIEAGVAEDFAAPQDLKVQELVDTAMVLGHRLPNEPILQAGARLSGEAGARLTGGEEYGNAFPLWTDYSETLLREAKHRGELLPQVVVRETAELVVSSFYGVQVHSQLTSGWVDAEQRLSVLFNHILPSIVLPAILTRLDTAPDRGRRIVAEMNSRQRQDLAPSVR